jgi:VanZ family protein
MISAKRANWFAVAGAALIAAIAVDSLVPVAWQVRSGLPWLIEHFLAYFAVTFVLCFAWPRPFIVAGALMALAGATEALQGLTADRVPDLPTAFCGAAGALTGALLAHLCMGARRERWADARTPADGA